MKKVYVAKMGPYYVSGLDVKQQLLTLSLDTKRVLFLSEYEVAAIKELHHTSIYEMQFLEQGDVLFE